jgi:dTDP-D-glucose 4,6-dehydratase
MIADEICVLDTSKAERELGWMPQYRDEDMLLAAYTEYRKKASRRPNMCPIAEQQRRSSQHETCQATDKTRRYDCAGTRPQSPSPI